MNRKVLAVIFLLNLLFFLYMLGLKTQAEEKLEVFKLRWKLTTEELHYAASMLTTEDLRKVQERFKANDEFLKAVFPPIIGD